MGVETAGNRGGSDGGSVVRLGKSGVARGIGRRRGGRKHPGGRFAKRKQMENEKIKREGDRVWHDRGHGPKVAEDEDVCGERAGAAVGRGRGGERGEW